jgi:hypothetical protein
MHCGNQHFQQSVFVVGKTSIGWGGKELKYLRNTEKFTKTLKERLLTHN